MPWAAPESPKQKNRVPFQTCNQTLPKYTHYSESHQEGLWSWNGISKSHLHLHITQDPGENQVYAAAKDRSEGDCTYLTLFGRFIWSFSIFRYMTYAIHHLKIAATDSSCLHTSGKWHGLLKKRQSTYMMKMVSQWSFGWIGWSKKIHVFFSKIRLVIPPPGSNLDTDTFVMCIQTPFQVDMFWHLGNGFIGINATHNVTQYPNFLLFMIIVRDWWGCSTW